MSPEHRSLLHVSYLFVACVSVWSWLALQFMLQDLRTALIAMLQVYTHCLYSAVWYTSNVCVCVCVCPIIGGDAILKRKTCMGLRAACIEKGEEHLHMSPRT